MAPRLNPSTDWMEQVKNIIEQMIESRSFVLQGYITSVNPTTQPYQVKVMLEPYEVETGWLPYQTPALGNGWGLILPPPDEQTVVTVVFDMAEFQNGKVIAGEWNEQTKMPNVPAGTFGLVHSTGAELLINPDGSISLLNSAGYGITVSKTGQVQIKGSTTTQTW